MIRLATIGTSAITEKFLAACKLTNRYIFHTAYSRDKVNGNNFAEKYGFLCSSDDIYKVAENPEINAVYIASPNVFHYAQSKLFLLNGKHVLCEKPIVTSSKEYEELISLAKEKRVIYMEAIMSRHTEGRAILKSAISQIGKISIAKMDYCQLSARYNDFLSGKQVNIFDMSLGAGTLMDLGVYCVYAAVDLLGQPIDIDASSVFLKNGADSAGSAIFKYDDFIASLTYSKVGQNVIGSEIIGDKGSIKIGWISQYAGITLCKNGEERELIGYPNRSEIMSGEAVKFADYIEKYNSFKNDYFEVEKLTRTVHKCMDIIKEKANIKYDLVEVNY